ncbi:MAG: hypothetical protein LBF97_00585, partial [Elusimicrobiota bacterium]|nr:hypothetical protein [Elusimicrobiota bacterium]
MIKKLENTLFFEFSKFSNIKKLKLNFLLLLKKKNFLLIFFFIIIVNQNNIFITDLFSSNEINIDTSQSILNDNIDKFFKIYDNFFEEIITDYNFDSAGNYKFYKTKKTIKENEK